MANSRAGKELINKIKGIPSAIKGAIGRRMELQNAWEKDMRAGKGEYYESIFKTAKRHPKK